MEIGNSKRSRVRKKNWPLKSNIPTSGNRNVNPTDPIQENGQFSPSDGKNMAQDQNGTPAPYTMMPPFSSSRRLKMIKSSRMKRMSLFPSGQDGGSPASVENQQGSQNSAQAPWVGPGEQGSGVDKQEGYSWLTDLSKAFKKYVSRTNGKRNNVPLIKDQTHLDAAGD
jgi:hypothetical protein